MLQVAYHVAEGVPRVVYGDPQRLQQVRGGGGDARLHATTCKCNPCVRLGVCVCEVLGAYRICFGFITCRCARARAHVCGCGCTCVLAHVHVHMCVLGVKLWRGVVPLHVLRVRSVQVGGAGACVCRGVSTGWPEDDSQRMVSGPLCRIITHTGCSGAPPVRVRHVPCRVIETAGCHMRPHMALPVTRFVCNACLAGSLRPRYTTCSALKAGRRHASCSRRRPPACMGTERARINSMCGC